MDTHTTPSTTTEEAKFPVFFVPNTVPDMASDPVIEYWCRRNRTVIGTLMETNGLAETSVFENRNDPTNEDMFWKNRQFMLDGDADSLYPRMKDGRPDFDRFTPEHAHNFREGMRFARHAILCSFRDVDFDFIQDTDDPRTIQMRYDRVVRELKERRESIDPLATESSLYGFLIVKLAPDYN